MLEFIQCNTPLLSRVPIASCQEFGLSLCKAVDEARRHADVDGLSGAHGQIALATYTTQFSRSLGPEKTFSDPADLPNNRLVLSWWSHQSNVMVDQTLVPFMIDLTIFTEVAPTCGGAVFTLRHQKVVRD